MFDVYMRDGMRKTCLLYNECLNQTLQAGVFGHLPLAGRGRGMKSAPRRYNFRTIGHKDTKQQQTKAVNKANLKETKNC